LKIFAQNVQEIGTKTFQNATKLERLELDYNKLTRLDQGAFEGAENLKFLYLHSNNIDLIEDGAFEGS
jgi:slit protein 2